MKARRSARLAAWAQRHGGLVLLALWAAIIAAYVALGVML